jgi:hypothetical protein
MSYKILRVSLVAVPLLLIAAVAAQAVGDQVPFPKEFRDWFVVNSMIISKESPILDQLGGMHRTSFGSSNSSFCSDWAATASFSGCRHG